MAKKVDSKAVGLDIGLLIGRFFMDTEDLHYGYWPDDKTAAAQNFAEAQYRHSQLIIDNIPEWNILMPPLSKIEDPLNHKIVISLRELVSEIDKLIPSS